MPTISSTSTFRCGRMCLAVALVWLILAACEGAQDPSGAEGPDGTVDAGSLGDATDAANSTADLAAESGSSGDATAPVDAPANDVAADDLVVVPDGLALSDVATGDVAAATDAVVGCCAADYQCPVGQICAVSPDGKLGQCIAPAPPGSCLRKADCPNDQVCLLVGTGDFKYCAAPLVPGTCKLPQTSGACCTSPASTCVGFTACVVATVGIGAVCQAKPTSGTCWVDTDCPSLWTCAGAVACGCSGCDPKATKPGTCIPPVGVGCCAPDGSCPASQVCIAAKDGTSVCHSATLAAGCLDHVHCPGGWCKSAYVAGCGTNAGKPDGLGTCKPQVGALACCTGDFQCQTGLACVHGVCAALNPGQCLLATDCGNGQTCEGGTVSSCPYPSDFPPPMPKIGLCGPAKSGQCCDKVNGCGAGLDCVGSAKPKCLPTPAATTCWKDADCGAGGLCAGATVGNCNVGGDKLGTCVAAGSQKDACCTTAGTCAAGLVCGGTEKNPVCKPTPPAGKCWGKAQCGANEVCLGAVAQQCAAQPTAIEALGACVDAAPGKLGECCGNGKGYSGNLACAMKETCVCAGQGCVCAVTGTCGQPLQFGECWQKYDCLGPTGSAGTCEGAVTCACGEANCTASAGKCAFP